MGVDNYFLLDIIKLQCYDLFMYQKNTPSQERNITMDNKKIISHPTPKTSPDLLVYGKDKFADISNHNDKVIDDYIVLPRSFNDAMKSFPIIQKYQNGQYPKKFFWRQKIREYFQNKYGTGRYSMADTNEGYALMGAAIVGGAILFIASLYIYLSFFCENPELESSQNNAACVALIVLILYIIVAAWFVCYSPWGIDYDEEDMKNLQYKIPKEDKRSVYEAQFMCIDKYAGGFSSFHSKEILYLAEKSVYKLFMDTDPDILNSMQIVPLSQSYDDFMDMLVFTLANSENISAELIDDYTQELYKRLEVFQEMTEDMVNVTSDMEEYQETAYQNSLDDEAVMFMPVYRKNK